MVWQIIILILTSSVKFLFAPLVSLSMGFDKLQTILFTSLGGALGVLVFYFLSAGLMKKALERRIAKVKAGLAKPKKNFTRINKLIVRVKHKMGLPGIAFLTLPIISVPLCAIISAKFFRHRNDTLAYLMISVLIWSVTLTYAYSIF